MSAAFDAMTAMELRARIARREVSLNAFSS
jgi:hypothetical protein